MSKIGHVFSEIIHPRNWKGIMLFARDTIIAHGTLTPKMRIRSLETAIWNKTGKKVPQSLIERGLGLQIYESFGTMKEIGEKMEDLLTVFRTREESSFGEDLVSL